MYLWAFAFIFAHGDAHALYGLFVSAVSMRIIIIMHVSYIIWYENILIEDRATAGGRPGEYTRIAASVFDLHSGEHAQQRR